MASVNKWIGIGNLGKDPEIRYTQGGDAIANFSIACTESWKDKQTGEKKEMNECVLITVFGKLAEICGQYLKKGSQVYVEGSMRTRKWTDKDGQERYTTEIRCDDMKMLGGRTEVEQKQQEPRNAQGAERSNDLADDIPFAKRKDY